VSNSNQQQLRQQRQEQASEARLMKEELLYLVELNKELAVKVGETTGFDEMMVLKKIGKDFTATGAGAFAYRNALICRSLKRVRTGPAPEGDPQGGNWVMFDKAKGEEFLAALTSKEKARLESVYSQVNELSEDEREELKNGLTPSIES
jgi:hypothetical protein